MYWKFGFGWMSIIGLLIISISTILAPNSFKWFLIPVLVFWILLMIIRYRKWNSSPWRQIHFRSMLLFARLVSEETLLAHKENRQFNVEIPTRKLAYALVGEDKIIHADIMVDYLAHEQGDYYQRLIKEYYYLINPDMNIIDLRNLIKSLGEIKFGPQLIIANVLENTYGGEEATRYLIALLKGEAA